jgi:hypothetical protein
MQPKDFFSRRSTTLDIRYGQYAEAKKKISDFELHLVAEHTIRIIGKHVKNVNWSDRLFKKFATVWIIAKFSQPCWKYMSPDKLMNLVHLFKFMQGCHH